MSPASRPDWWRSDGGVAADWLSRSRSCGCLATRGLWILLIGREGRRFLISDRAVPEGFLPRLAGGRGFGTNQSGGISRLGVALLRCLEEGWVLSSARQPSTCPRAGLEVVPGERRGSVCVEGVGGGLPLLSRPFPRRARAVPQFTHFLGAGLVGRAGRQARVTLSPPPRLLARAGRGVRGGDTRSSVTCREGSSRSRRGARAGAGAGRAEAERRGRAGPGRVMAALDPQSPVGAGLAGEEALEEEEEEAEPEPGPENPEDSDKAAPGCGPGSGAAGPGGGGRGCVLTRRGITLRVLLKDALIEPGCGVLSIYYLGKKFIGDLLPDGKITWQETGQVFNSPSAWATYCKKLVNPAKKSGCGWASVKYKGQKLDQYKATWLKRHQPNAPSTAEESLVSEGEEEELLEEEEEEAAVAREGKMLTPASTSTLVFLEEKGRKQLGKVLTESPHPEAGPPGKRPENKGRVPVRYCTLGSRDLARNPHTLVEVTSFTAINKFQPFNVSVSSNVLLLLDFHSHLTRSEVVGYLGGRWDTNSQLLTVLRAFPCRSRLGDADTAAAIEEEICQSLFLRGLSLVGWYHSHPYSPALPSLQDIDAQMDYQLKLQGSSNSFQPCLALVCAPYYSGNQGPESKISPFWVMPPPEQRPNDYGIPMEVEMTYIQDGFLTNDILHEMMLLVDFYKGAPDVVKFQDLWNQEQTYLDKLKVSLASRTPKDQGLCHVLEQVYCLLKNSS